MIKTIASLYVRKDILDKRFPNLKIPGVKIINPPYELFYDITYEYSSYVRLIKIYKLLKKENLTIEFIEFCYENISSYNDVIAAEGAEMIAKQIDKDIMKKIMNMGGYKKK